MRLLFVIDNLESGGAQRQLVTLAIQLVDSNHEVEFFVYQERNHFKDLLDQAGIKIIKVKKTWKYSFKPIWKLRRCCQKNSYDAILAFLTTPNFYSIISQFFSIKKIPVIVSERSGVVAGTRSLKEKLVFKFYRFAKRIVCNSYHMRDYFIQNQKRNPDKVATIWNGLDLNKFQHKDIAQQHNTYQFNAVGNIRHSKQWMCLIEAMYILNEKYNLKIKVNYVGKDYKLSPVNDQYLEQMKQALSHWNLEDQWNWLGQQKNMPELYSNSMALIHPSVLEGLPNVVCESLACGRPVIASDMLDHPRLVQNKKTGYLFEPYSAASLADVIYELCRLDKDQLCEMSNNARKFAEKNLAVKTLANQYENLFAELIPKDKAVNQ